MNPISTRTAERQNTPLDNYDKGGAFEAFIIRLFNERSFYLKRWRKAKKYAHTDIPHDYCDPDLEIELVFSGARKYRFAVECKWRSAFKDGRIEWAKSRQICTYEDFQRRTGVPVFVAIGVGGAPGNPEKLFVTPLDNICQYTEVYEANLIEFKRRPSRRFFYDIRQLRLF